MPQHRHRFQKAKAEEAEQIRQESSAQTQGESFGSVDELLRFDAKHTSPPDSLPARLAKSLSAERKPRPWWKRLFG